METHNAAFRYLVPYASSSGAIRRARKRPRAAQPAAQPAANGAPPPLLATPSPSLIPSPSPSPRANARTPRANGLPMPELMPRRARRAGEQARGRAQPDGADALIKLGANGFGSIGRQVVRIAVDRESFVLKHINSSMTPEYMKYLLEHDSVHGLFLGTCAVDGDAGLLINGAKVPLSATRLPTKIPWKSTGASSTSASRPARSPPPKPA